MNKFIVVIWVTLGIVAGLNLVKSKGFFWYNIGSILVVAYLMYLLSRKESVL
jgi:hypothetical protein